MDKQDLASALETLQKCCQQQARCSECLLGIVEGECLLGTFHPLDPEVSEFIHRLRNS